MAYELSEAFYASLSMQPTQTLNNAKNDPEQFETLYESAITNFQSGSILDGAGYATKQGMTRGLTDENYDGRADCASMISAVLGTRSTAGIPDGPPSQIYLTGNSWHKDIQVLKIKAFGMSDYNSSDIILGYGGGLKIGISLKKKPSLNAASPPLINNSFATFIKGPALRSLLEKINNVRMEFFAGVLQDACLTDDILTYQDGSKLEECDEIAGLDPSIPAHAQKIWDMRVTVLDKDGNPKKPKIALINLKDVSYLHRALNRGFSVRTQQKFNKYVNTRLRSTGGQLNPLFQGFINVMNEPEVANTIADSMMNRVLKLSMYDELPAAFWDGSEYKFYLVEGAGRYNKSGPVVENAYVESLHSTMVTMIALNKEPARIVIDKATFSGKSASVKFNLYKGKYNLLHITLRYGGSFSAFPRFHAVTTSEFKKLVKQGDKWLTGVGSR